MRRAAVLLAAICLAGRIAGEAKADGTIILNRASDFQPLVADGTITGFQVGNSAPQQVASGQALQTAFQDTLTAASTSVSASSPYNGLFTSSAATAQHQYIGAWTYGYHLDPDLTDYTVNLRLFLPQVGSYVSGVGPPVSGINAVTITLTSVNSAAVTGSRSWSFDNNLNPNILHAGLEDFSLAAVEARGAGGSNDFHQDTDFDLRQVLYVSIGYRGYFDSSFPIAPDGTNSFWAGTESLNVTQTPEPNSALVLSCFLLGTGLVRSTLRARSRRRK